MLVLAFLFVEEELFQALAGFGGAHADAGVDEGLAAGAQAPVAVSEHFDRLNFYQAVFLVVCDTLIRVDGKHGGRGETARCVRRITRRVSLLILHILQGEIIVLRGFCSRQALAFTCGDSHRIRSSPGCRDF